VAIRLTVPVVQEIMTMFFSVFISNVKSYVFCVDCLTLWVTVYI